MLEIKRVLKLMNSEIFYKILTISKLDDVEKKLLQEFILRDNPRDIVCEKLNVSRSTFNNIKQKACLKVQLSLVALLDEKIAHIA